MTMDNNDKNHNIYDSGFDQHLNRKSAVEEADRQFQARIKEERDRGESRERIRIQRLAASGKNLLVYALDIIIEKCLINEKKERIEIDSYSLGFPENIQEVMNAARFLDSLKDEGCFENFERSANIYFIIHKPSIEKLTEYKSKLENRLDYHVVQNQKYKVDFDSLNCVLRFGTSVHAFHKKHHGEDIRIRLFKKLWDERRHIKRGKIMREGQSFPPESLASNLDIVSSASVFANDRKAKSRLFGLIKGIDRILRDKKFPASIDRHNGILLLVEEK